MEPRNRAMPGCRRAPNTRKATAGTPLWQGVHAPGGVADPWPARKHRERDSGGPASGRVDRSKARMVHHTDTTMMHGGRESDSAIVPTKRLNKGTPELRQNTQAHAAPAVVVEGRALAKGNSGQHHRVRTPRRAALSRALDRGRQAAQESNCLDCQGTLGCFYAIATSRGCQGV
jgi:hypothetical protein